MGYQSDLSVLLGLKWGKMKVKKGLSAYQVRMGRFTAIVWLYSIGSCFAIVTDLASPEGMVFFTGLCIFAGMARGFDAVRDSLHERLNLQSSWLNIRLLVLENATNAQSGYKAWEATGAPGTDEGISIYYNEYPELIP